MMAMPVAVEQVKAHPAAILLRLRAVRVEAKEVTMAGWVGLSGAQLVQGRHRYTLPH